VIAAGVVPLVAVAAERMKILAAIVLGASVEATAALVTGGRQLVRAEITEYIVTAAYRFAG